MLPLPAVQLATQFVAGIGVSKILGDIVKNNVVTLTKTQVVTVKVGTFVLGSMLVDQSSKHIETVANQLADAFKKKDEEEPPNLKEVS